MGRKDAQIEIGVLQQSDNEAAEWCRQANGQGRPDAQFKLGFFCGRGSGGLQQSDEEATKRYQKGHEDAAAAIVKLGVQDLADMAWVLRELQSHVLLSLTETHRVTPYDSLCLPTRGEASCCSKKLYSQKRMHQNSSMRD